MHDREQIRRETDTFDPIIGESCYITHQASETRVDSRAHECSRSKYFSLPLSLSLFLSPIHSLFSPSSSLAMLGQVALERRRASARERKQEEEGKEESALEMIYLVLHKPRTIDEHNGERREEEKRKKTSAQDKRREEIIMVSEEE